MADQVALTQIVGSELGPHYRKIQILAGVALNQHPGDHPQRRAACVYLLELTHTANESLRPARH